MSQYEPRLIRLDMGDGRPFYQREVLAPVVETLRASKLFAPQYWGLDERTERPFNMRAVLQAASGKSSPFILLLKRKERLSHTTHVRLNNKPGLILDLSPGTPVEDRHQLFDLADALAGAYMPDFGWVHLFSEVSLPLACEEDEAFYLLDSSIVGSGTRYEENGPAGLGMRTYFGPRLVELIGRDLLLSTPVLVKELPWGGVRLDLVAEAWKSSKDVLLAAWRVGMEHLRASKAFAEVQIGKNGGVRIRRGERFSTGAR